MASQALMWDKKAFPRPCPSEAPLTNPAMSVTFRKAGTLLQAKVHFVTNYYYLHDFCIVSQQECLHWLAFLNKLTLFLGWILAAAKHHQNLKTGLFSDDSRAGYYNTFTHCKMRESGLQCQLSYGNSKFSVSRRHLEEENRRSKGNSLHINS